MIEIGDLVFCNVSYKKDEQRKECFVEEVLSDEKDWRFEKNGIQVSLYATNGEYIGDYWEKELEITGKKVDIEILKKLLKKAVNEAHWGLVWDFAKVAMSIGVDKERKWVKA